MRRNLTVLLTVIVLMISGMGLSYAAFPLDAQNEKTTTIVDNSPLPDEPKKTQAQKTAEKIEEEIEPAETAHTLKKTGKSQIIAAILGFFVGVMGIHRFYLGYTWQGVVQLLTGGGCGIWALIDFVRILMNDLGPKDGKYAKTFK